MADKITKLFIFFFHFFSKLVLETLTGNSPNFEEVELSPIFVTPQKYFSVCLSE